MATTRACVLVLAMLVARSAAAEEEVSTRRRVAAVFAAIFPGFILRGTGSYLVHERRTARRLAKTAAIGLGGVALGGLPVALSNASSYTIPLIPVALVGTGLALTSWFSDIAVAAGAEHTFGRPRAAPPWSLEVGTTWLHDAYRERGLATATGTLELGRFGVGAGTLLDAEGKSRDGDAELRFRILGAPATGTLIHDGSRLYARAGTRIHRDDDDRVTLATGDAELLGRLDLVHVDRVLEGTFVDLSTGIAVERASYAGTHDYGSVLLGGFAWGVYLGERGEAKLFYDHRRDSIAGGIAAWRAAGFVGSVGANVDVLVSPRWAVRTEVEVGNAWVTTFAIRYHGGK